MKPITPLIFVLAISVVASAQKHSPNGNQKAIYECSDPMDIDSTLIPLKSDTLYFHFNTEETFSNLDSMGFVWLRDNPKRYFAAYLVNTTNSTFTAKRQDGSLIMIQEALDKEGNWKPIEYWVYSGCGNSYFYPLKLDSGKCVLVPIKKYAGNFKTKIRLKFKYSKAVMYSTPFEGAIDEAQFNKETDEVYGILYHGPANYLDQK